MRVLFCKISSMKYYKGACENDVPVFGGKFVEENVKKFFFCYDNISKNKCFWQEEFAQVVI